MLEREGGEEVVHRPSWDRANVTQLTDEVSMTCSLDYIPELQSNFTQPPSGAGEWAGSGGCR
jgi:hypothetical protein